MWKAWLVLLAAMTAQTTSNASLADEVPRYRLDPGMVLSYEGRSTIKHGTDTFLEDQDTTAWVVRRNPDGSSRIVIRVGSRFHEAASPQTGKAPVKEQRKPSMDYSLGYFARGCSGLENRIAHDEQ